MQNQANVGFQSGGKNYDSNRPSYTNESVDLIVSEIISTSKTIPGTGVKYDVLELGAGTGKMTERLSKKLPGNMKYLASDPSENFLGVLKSKDLDVDVIIASADNIPLEDRSVVNVVCAQCFHWFFETKNLESIRRVLVPGGKLILIWNMKQFDLDWMPIYFKQHVEIEKRLGRPHNLLINTSEWRRDIDVSQDFKCLWHKTLAGTNFHGDLEAILANITTISGYNLLPAEERDAYVEKLREALKNWPGLDISNMSIPFKTELSLYVAQ